MRMGAWYRTLTPPARVNQARALDIAAAAYRTCHVCRDEAAQLLVALEQLTGRTIDKLRLDDSIRDVLGPVRERLPLSSDSEVDSLDTIELMMAAEEESRGSNAHA